LTPAIDIVEEDVAFVINVELPGIWPDDVTVSFDDHVLTIRGERKPEVAEGDAFRRRERSYGAFCRALALPDRVDATVVRYRPPLVAAMRGDDVALLRGVADMRVSRLNVSDLRAQAGEMRRSALVWTVLTAGGNFPMHTLRGTR
jgi:hypothetical protein